VQNARKLLKIDVNENNYAQKCLLLVLFLPQLKTSLPSLAQNSIRSKLYLILVAHVGF